MPRPSLDLEAFEKLCDEVLQPAAHPAVQLDMHEQEINDTAELMRTTITTMDRARQNERAAIGNFTTLQDLDRQFIMDGAMGLILADYGVQEVYLSGEGVIPFPNGWRVSLRRPSSTGLFEVQVVTSQNPKRHQRQTLFYKAVAA